MPRTPLKERVASRADFGRRPPVELLSCLATRRAGPSDRLVIRPLLWARSSRSTRSRPRSVAELQVLRSNQSRSSTSRPRETASYWSRRGTDDPRNKAGVDASVGVCFRVMSSPEGVDELFASRNSSRRLLGPRGRSGVVSILELRCLHSNGCSRVHDRSSPSCRALPERATCQPKLSSSSTRALLFDDASELDGQIDGRHGSLIERRGV